MKLFVTYHRATTKDETSSKFAIIPAKDLKDALKKQREHFDEAYAGLDVKVVVEDGTLLDLKLAIDFIKAHVPEVGIRYIIDDLKKTLKEGK